MARCEKSLTEEASGSSTWQRVGTLGLLTLCYTLGELGHFLIATTSKQVANSLQFGDLRCYVDHKVHLHNVTNDVCMDVMTQAGCEAVGGCVWCFSGQGWQYQVLAGPGFIVMFTICGVIMGYLADRISRPRLLSISTLVFSVCLMLSGLATSYVQLLLLRMGLAAGEAAIRPAGGSLIAEIFPAKQRAIANGIFSWGIYLGYGLAFLFGFYLTDMDVLGFSWRSSYVLAGVPGLLLCPALLLIPEPRPVSLDTPTVLPPSVSVRKLSYGYELSQQRYQRKVSLERPEVPSYIDLVTKAFTSPVMIGLFVAASTRHMAGYAWAHNSVSYFHDYHSGKEIGVWFMITAITGGCLGVFSGGYLSDLLVTRLGVHSRLWLLGVATIFATPLAAMTLHFDPPIAFITLLFYYFFAETWFSLLFTVLVEIVPVSIRSISIGTFLFLMNNVGGNLPLLVDPLSKLPGVGLQTALYISWPGLTAISGVLFLFSGLQLWNHDKQKRKPGLQKTESAS